jgi:hypothetical protein
MYVFADNKESFALEEWSSGIVSAFHLSFGS